MPQTALNKELILKTIRLEPPMVEQIQKMANQSERNFTEQVRYMLKEYIKIKEQITY